MIFIVRTSLASPPNFDVKMTRRTPAIVPGSAGQHDYFCRGDPDVAKAGGWPVVPVHDGWYADDQDGGMAIWGQGMFWEVRDTPFTVKEACGPDDWPSGPRRADDSDLNVRQAIFRG
jgi:hypothetical protein